MSHWSKQATNGGVLIFDRQSGLNILTRSKATSGLEREAPRVLQVGLLTPCNLRCSFCYRDTAATSRLTSEFLLDLLGRCAKWGVLEVAFGGGEPLLFRGFTELVQAIARDTTLGVNFTTNGTLLTDEVLARLEGWPGEIRVSAYDDNGYRNVLRRLNGCKAGINWLVTPRNLGQLEIVVQDCLRLGARNVMLLGYKGADPALHLSTAQLEQLAGTVARLQHLPLRLDICWHPHLRSVPQLFERSDCGAGDEILVITPDRAVQPCSFHHERIRFDSFEDLQRIYSDFRNRKPAATINGCTRADFQPVAPPPPSVYLWHAHASNNSGDATIVGRFRTAAEAERAAAAIREVAAAHERFMATPEAQDGDPAAITPPLNLFAEAHGFEWPEEDSLWWEEQAYGAPQLTAGALGNHVILYHDYCMGLPQEAFARFFENAGAVEFYNNYGARPWMIATARGANENTVRAIQQYFALLKQHKFAHEFKEPPPWGLECNDPRVAADCDRSAELSQTATELTFENGSLKIRLCFENAFAGPLALEKYLREAGFEQIELSFEEGFKPLDTSPEPIEPKTGLFADAPSLAAQLMAMTPEKRWERIFGDSPKPRETQIAIAKLPVDEAVETGFAVWRRIKDTQPAAYYSAAEVIERTGRPASAWARELWDDSRGRETWWVVKAVVRTFPLNEVVDLALQRLGESKRSIDFPGLVCRAIEDIADAALTRKEELPLRRRFESLLDVLRKEPVEGNNLKALERLRSLTKEFPA